MKVLLAKRNIQSFIKKVTLFYFLSLTATLLNAQDSTGVSNKTNSFINEKANSIINPGSLNRFFEKLYSLKQNQEKLVTLLHIGDSHIQADMLTGTTRSRLQQEFGNAGLGLVLPGRVARTNESPLVKTSYTGAWESAKITHSQPAFPIGIGGVTLSTKAKGSALQIKVMKDSVHNYSFDRLQLFFQKDFKSYSLTIKDSAGSVLGYAGSFTDETFPYSSQLRFSKTVSQVKIETDQTDKQQSQLTLFGISVQNSKSGVLYHTLGVNGATYKNFVSGSQTLNQTKSLNADLIIISLGTNEAISHPHIDNQFTRQVETMIETLKENNPYVCILLTTPPDSFKKKTRRNPGVKIITQAILKIAEKNQVSCWNLNEVAGGNHSADLWKKNKLLQNDGIHFTATGYRLQGDLLFEALMNGYNDYVLNRH